MSLVMILPFLVMLNGLRIPVGGSSVGVDQLAACLLLIPLGVSALLGRRVRTDATVSWLVAILGLNVVASLLYSPTLSYSLLQCVNLAAAWSIYVVVRNALETRETIDSFLRAVLTAAIIAGVAGIAAFALALAGLDVGGAEVSATAVSRLTQAYGAYGFMVEPNIFGSFAAAHFVLAVLLLRGERRLLGDTTLVTLARWTAGVSFVALVVSFTRAAWLGAAAGLVAAALIGPRVFDVRVRAAVILKTCVAVTAVVGLLLLVPGDVGTVFRFKLVNLVNPQSQTAVIRLLTWGIALQQSATHPIVGWGTFTFAPLLAEGSDFQRFDNWRNLWIGNYLLLALHDTGVVGLFSWIGMLWSVVGRGMRSARAAVQLDPLVALRTIALVGAVIAIIIPFLATTGFSLGFPWMIFGLLGAHSRIATSTAGAPVPAAVASPAPMGHPIPADAI